MLWKSLDLCVVIVLCWIACAKGNEVTTVGCFERNRNFVHVVVDFENDNPRARDWIGIYFPSVSIDDELPDRGDRWVRACGTRGCTGSRASGRVTIRTNLIAGLTFKAVLARNSHMAIAESAPFEVQTSCSGTSVTTNKRVYGPSERIRVPFELNNPSRNDFIGIYRDNVPPNNLRNNGALWQWTCGGQGAAGCPNRPGDAVLVFRANGRPSDWSQSFPLSEGSYFAYLLSDFDNPPYAVIARSPRFRIRAPAANMATRMANLRSDLEDLINNDLPLAAKFLRLSFHDCVGGCDGCVDMQNPENAGLEVPIQALRSVVNTHAGNGLTRTDIWMMAAIVGADVSQPSQNRINFPFQFFGRTTCEDANTVCRNESGQSVPCSDVRGPHRHIPEADLTTVEFFRFFRQEFDFSTEETVALMGAHTIGELTRENSGIDGPNGWVLGNRVLDNEYYFELVGGDSFEDGEDIFINDAPNWQRDFEDNSDLPGIPSKHIWTGFPQRTKIVMLNVDIAVVRSLNDENMDENGQVSCTFIRTGSCPHAEGALQQAARYKFDNLLWLRDFRAVMERMVNHGSLVPACPTGQVCMVISETAV